MLTDLQSFKARAAVIADQAHNPRGALGEGAEFMRGLDESERQCTQYLPFQCLRARQGMAGNC